MPTYEQTDRFRREFDRLSPDEQAAFRAALRKFVHDLRAGAFRRGLRVKRFRRLPGIWEMTWADDGRALFAYGDPVRPGEPHVIWLRIGSHAIFDEP
jgi:hypothetical protein